MRSFSSSQIWEPPMEQAWAEAVTMSCQPSSPASMASITSSRVITLVTEAGSYRVWASFSKSTVPVDFSMSRALGADTSGPAGAAQRAAGDRSRQARAAARAAIRFMGRPLFHMVCYKDVEGGGKLCAGRPDLSGNRRAGLDKTGPGLV